MRTFMRIALVTVAAAGLALAGAAAAQADGGDLNFSGQTAGSVAGEGSTLHVDADHGVTTSKESVAGNSAQSLAGGTQENEGSDD